MMLREGLLRKSLSILLVIQLMVNPAAVKVVLAEETPTPIESPQSSTPVEQSDSTPSPTTSPESTVAPSEPSPTTAPAEETPTSAPTAKPTSTSPDPPSTPDSSSLSPTPTVVSSINTGDANASSNTDTTVNNNKDTVNGTLETPPGNCSPPEGQTTCPDDIDITNDNQATVSATTDSSANTGGNQESGSAGDATINTGDATASGTINNEINSNTVAIGSTQPADPISATPTPTISLSPDESSPEVGGVGGLPPEEKTLTVENNNNADVKNQQAVTASTGENIALDNLGDVDVQTGNAIALANILNLLNTNLVGSNFELLFLDWTGSGDQSINLNLLWEKILEKGGSDSLVLVGEEEGSNLKISIFNSNRACLLNKVDVIATTGGNQANNNDSAEVETGDAVALANVANVVNTNILGTKFFFGIINIFGSNSGNIILPRPEKFMTLPSSTENSQGGVTVNNSNEAKIDNSLNSSAQTGNNQANDNEGGSNIETGEADSLANSITLANLNLWRNIWFYFQLNNLGGWEGNVLGWSSPEASETSGVGGQTFQIGSDYSSENGAVGASGSPSEVIFQNQNQADVKNEINVLASTGGNKANGNKGGSNIQTGRARSVANLVNLVNLNILGGYWFLSFVNILGNWSGNAIFAYPDVTVSLLRSNDQIKVGEVTSFTVLYSNQGYDEANDVKVKLDLPSGVSYLNDDSGSKPQTEGESYLWSIGKLKVGQQGSFTVSVKINPDFHFEEGISFWSRIVPSVYAAENAKEKKIKLIASIVTGDPESDNSNNSSVAETIVYQPIEVLTNSENSSNGDDGDQRQPKLEITAWNNVNQFVYAGDTVTFEITIENTSDVPSYNTYLIQKLYDGAPEDFGSFKFDIGIVGPKKKGRLSFGLKLSEDDTIKAGSYRTVAQAFGEAPNGSEISSNEAKTNFEVRLRIIAFSFEAIAAEEKGEVLGEQKECPIPKEKILPYVLLFILSSLWIVDRGRRISEKFLIKNEIE